MALCDAHNAIARDPSSATAQVRAGRALLGLSRADDAVDAFRDALALNAIAAGANAGLKRALAASAEQEAARQDATVESLKGTSRVRNAMPPIHLLLLRFFPPANTHRPSYSFSVCVCVCVCVCVYVCVSVCVCAFLFL